MKKSIAIVLTMLLIVQAMITIPFFPHQVSAKHNHSHGHEKHKNLAEKANLEVEFSNVDTTASDKITTKFRITNKGSSNVKLSDVTLRYYYTSDKTVFQKYLLTDASISKWDIKTKLKRTKSDLHNADHYLEIGFKGRAGHLKPQEQVELSGKIYNFFRKDYDFSNDYSFKPKTELSTWDKVTAYVKKEKVWGVEPSQQSHNEVIPETPKVEIVQSEGQAVLSWSEVENADSYTVKRGTLSGQYEVLESKIIEGSYTDTLVDTNTSYYYVVNAVKGSQTSSDSNEVVYKAIPKAPELYGVKVGDTIRLSWNTSNGAEKYNVYGVSSDGEEKYSIAENILINSHEIKDVVDGATYYFVVTAVNETGESSNSNRVEISEKTNGKIDYTSKTLDDDKDGISNVDELIYATDPIDQDTDRDGIFDGREIELGTSPIDPDTDKDGIYDGAEIKHSTDPLDGSDDANKYTSVIENSVDFDTSEVIGFNSVSVEAKGDANLIGAPLYISLSNNMIINTIPGIIGKAVEITTGGYPIDNATITFECDAKTVSEMLGEDKTVNDLTVFNVNYETRQLEELNNTDVSVTESVYTISAETEHFSTFLLGVDGISIDIGNVDTVMTIDQSGSMSNNDRSCYRIDAAQKFVEEMDVDHNKIGIVAFTGSADKKSYLPGQSSKPGLSNNINELTKVLENMRGSGGGTDIYEAINVSASMFDTSDTSRKVIILLTDGQDGNSSIVPTAEKLFKEQGIVINTVAFGTGADTKLLQDIASATSGSYFYINNTKGMTKEDVKIQINLIYEKLSKYLTLQNHVENKLPSEAMSIKLDNHIGFDDKEMNRWVTDSNSNLMSGNYMEHNVDLRLESEVVDLTFERTYNSFASGESTILGKGFRTNYDSFIEANNIGTTTASMLNVRTGASTDYPVVYQLPRDTTVNIGEPTQNNWYKIEIGGKDYYIYGGFVNSKEVAKVTYPSGTQIAFESNGDGTYKTPVNSNDTLSLEGDNYTLTKSNKSKYKYNSDNKLSSIEDKNGNTTTINYNGGKIESVTDPVNRKLVFEYVNGTDRLEKIYVEDTPDYSLTFEYKEDDAQYLEKVIDANNKVAVKYTYDSEGRVFEVYSANLDENGNNERLKRNEYDAFGRLVMQYDCKDQIKYFVYNDKSMERFVIDQNGNESCIQFNADLKPVTEIDAKGNTVEYKYEVLVDGKYINTTAAKEDSASYYTEKRASRETRKDIYGNVTVYEKDKRGNITKITNPDDTEKTFTYYPETDILSSQVDEENKKTYYIYDEDCINLQKEITPLNGTDEYPLEDGNEDRFSITNYKYYSPQDCFGLKGMLYSVTDAENNETKYVYDKYGNFEQIHTPKDTNDDTNIVNNITNYTFNNLGRMENKVTPAGHETEYQYDNVGRLIRTIRKSDRNETTRIVYDNSGRKIKEVQPNQYNASLDGEDYTGEHGYRYEYYPNGKKKKVTDTEGNTTEYTYDPAWNLDKEIKANGAVYDYDYDSLNRLYKVWFMENREDDTKELLEEYTYDTQKVTDNHSLTVKTITKYYDELNSSKTVVKTDYAGRVIEQINADGGLVKCEYYKNGQIKSVTDANTKYKTFYKYNKLEELDGEYCRVDEKWEPLRDEEGTVKYKYTATVYDHAGKIKEVRTENDSIGVTFNEDSNTGTVPTNFSTTSYKYYSNGEVKEISQSNGKKTEYIYDADGNVETESITVGPDRTIKTKYINNYLGKPDYKINYVRKGDLYQNDIDNDEIIEVYTKYTYDLNSNLETETTANLKDAVTGLISESDESVTTTYGYDNMNRVESVSQPGVDEDGNEVEITTTTHYNWEGKKDLVTDAKGNTTKFEYNKRGFNTKIISGQSTTFYQYNRAGRLIAQVQPKDFVEGYDLDKMNRVTYTYDKADRIKTKGFIGKEKQLDSSDYSWKQELKEVDIITKAFKYDKNGNVVKELDALGYAAGMGSGKAVDEIIEDGYGTEYKYTPMNQVEEVIDPELSEDLPADDDRRYSTRYVYDTLGRVVSETTVKGYDLDSRYYTNTSYIYDDAENTMVITSKENIDVDEGISQTTELQRNVYDYVGNLIEQTDAENIKKATGIKSIFEYNSFNELKKEIQLGDGDIEDKETTVPTQTVCYQYDYTARIKKQTENYKMKNEDGNFEDVARINFYTYDNQGRVVKQEQYNENDKASTLIETSMNYDVNGNVRYKFDGKENKTEYTYDEFNRLEDTIVDLKDADGNVVSTHITSNEYDKNGNLKIVTKSVITGSKESVSTNWYEYDSMNRLIETGDDYTSIERLEYYDNGMQKLSCEAPNKDDSKAFRMTEYIYNKNGSLVETKEPKNTEDSNCPNNHIQSVEINRYDYAGNVRETEIGDKVTKYGYDHFDRLIEVENATGLEKTRYIYDLNGNMTSQEFLEREDSESLYNTIRTVSFEYNGLNLLIKKIDGEQETYRYYADGSMMEKSDRNKTLFTYIYDVHGRLLTQKAQNEEEELITSYQYDNNGNQTSVANETDTIIRTYDELNRVKEKTTNIGTVNYTYDIITDRSDVAEGLTAETSCDVKGNKTTKVFDRASRLKYVIDGDCETGEVITTYTYYPNGSRRSVEYEGDYIETYTYWEDGLLKQLTNLMPGGIENDKYIYQYDECHNQVEKYEVINGVEKGTTSYIYDRLNRLQTVVEPGGRTTQYTYDALGNRDTETVTAEGQPIIKTGYNYDFETNRLKDVKVWTDGIITQTSDYEYDNNGNVTKVTVEGSDETVNRYDLLNQLISTTKGSVTVNNRYNGEGLRVEKESKGTLTRYLYEYDKVVLELDHNGNQVGRNIYGTNLLERTKDGESYYYMYNGHADVTALINVATGDVDAEYYYDAFGNIVESTGMAKDKNSILYSGYQYDSETELYYLNARMYDPKVARFLQEDTYSGTANDPLSLNLYTYCVNNPLIYYDPTGHFDVFCGEDWMKLARDAKEVTSGIADGTMRFASGGTYQSVGDFANDVQWAFNNSEYLADGATSYVSETASDFKQNAVNFANDVKWAYNNRDIVAETVNEEVQQFKSDVQWAMDNKDIVAETTNEMATHAINEFNSKSLREKTAMITDVTLNVASFVGVPETAITKVAQIQKLDKLYDAVNLVNKMDDLYDAGMSMKRIDGFSDTLSVFKKSDRYVEASSGIKFADNIDDFGKVGIREIPKNPRQKNFLEVTRSGNNVDASTNIMMRIEASSDHIPMNSEKFNKIKNAFEKQGGLIVPPEEALPLLNYHGAEASTLNANTILFRENPTTSSVFEEFIHATQYRTGRATGNNIIEMEIEAKEKLIKFRKQYGIPNSETRDTIKQLKEYRQMLVK